MNKIALQKNMGNKILILVFFIFLFTGCSETNYQKIVVDNQNKSISVLGDDFVIDSICIQKFGVIKYSSSLNNKPSGANRVYLTKNNVGYEMYVNKLDSLNCNDENLSLAIYIRKKGSTVRVTEDISIGLEVTPDIQVLRGVRYSPCSNEIDSMETDRSFR